MAPEPPGHSEVFRNTSTHCAKCWGCHNEQTSLWPWEGHHPSEETVTSSRAEIYSSVYATGVKAADLPQGSGKATQKKQCSNQVSKDEELFVKSGNGTEVQRARDLKEFNAFRPSAIFKPQALATLQTSSFFPCLMDEVTKIQARRGTHEIHTQVRSVHNGTEVSRPQEKKACHDCLEKVISSGSTVRLHAWKLDLELKKTCLHSRPTSTPARWVLSSDLFFLSLSFLICQIGTIIVLMFVMRLELIHDKCFVQCPVYAECLGIKNWSLQFQYHHFLLQHDDIFLIWKHLLLLTLYYLLFLPFLITQWELTEGTGAILSE